MMTKEKLLETLDVERVVQAIERAEARTSAEICVSVAPFFWGSLEQVARRAFAKLGIDRTRLRNGVLVFVVPSRRRLMILGDAGIHRRVGDDFWRRIAEGVSSRFGAGDFTGGLITAIDELGEVLTHHFPREAGDQNELPDLLQS